MFAAVVRKLALGYGKAFWLTLDPAVEGELFKRRVAHFFSDDGPRA